MRIAGVTLVLVLMLGTASAKGKLDIEVPSTFMGGIKQAATLIVTLRNDSSQLVELGYSDLQPYFKVTVTKSDGGVVKCRTPKAREKRGQRYQWLIDAKKQAPVRIDLLARCDLRVEGEYRVAVVLNVPGSSSRFWTGKTAVRTTTLKLGGGNGKGPASDGTIPNGCIAYNSVPPDKKGCTWVCGERPVCSGVESSEPKPAREPAFVCNGCMRHADCAAKPGGQCVLLDGDTCQSSAYACVYPNDACFPPARCDKACFVEDGQARCAAPSGPPP